MGIEEELRDVHAARKCCPVEAYVLFLECKITWGNNCIIFEVLKLRIFETDCTDVFANLVPNANVSPFGQKQLDLVHVLIFCRPDDGCPASIILIKTSLCRISKQTPDHPYLLHYIWRVTQTALDTRALFPVFDAKIFYFGAPYFQEYCKIMTNFLQYGQTSKQKHMHSLFQLSAFETGASHHGQPGIYSQKFCVLGNTWED